MQVTRFSCVFNWTPRKDTFYVLATLCLFTAAMESTIFTTEKLFYCNVICGILLVTLFPFLFFKLYVHDPLDIGIVINE